jgi:hypothetical protein
MLTVHTAHGVYKCFTAHGSLDIALILPVFTFPCLQSHAVAGYAPLITAYIRVLMTRISFIVKVTT